MSEAVLIQRDGRVWGADRRTLYGRIVQDAGIWTSACEQCDAKYPGRRRVDVVAELADHWEHSEYADSGAGASK